MKKLFVLLLTGVMCFCLLGINSNRVNAEDNDVVEITSTLVFGDGKVCADSLTGHEYSQTELESMGIYKGTGNEYTFKKSIKMEENNKSMLDNKTSNLKINIEGDLTFKQTKGLQPMWDFRSDSVVINGNNQAINLDSNSIVIGSNANLTLNNIKLNILGASDNMAVIIAGQLILNNSGMKIACSGGGPAINGFGNEPKEPGPMPIKSQKGSLTYPATGGLIDVVFDGDTYKDSVGGTAVRYLELNGWKDPEPSPTPIVKDESCEKVIGPTWHWNNTKGVCEEVSIVDTSTR